MADCSMREFDSSFRSDVERSFEVEDENDDTQRRNAIAFKSLQIVHASIAEKLYAELYRVSIGEYNVAGSNELSVDMWQNLYKVLLREEERSRAMIAGSSITTKTRKIAIEAVQLADIMFCFTSLSQSEVFAATKDESLLSHLIIEDIEFRRVYALLLWSEKAISEQQLELGITENVQTISKTRNTRVDSIMALTSSRFGNKTASIDPDEPGTIEDKKTETFVHETIYQLIRCGEISKATELAANVGLHTLAALLVHQQILRTPSELPLEPTVDHKTPHKRQRRAKYLKMLDLLIDASENHSNEKGEYLLILSALRGRVQPLLDNSNTIVEKVWAYANAAFIARILTAEGALTEEEVNILFNTPLTATSILHELIAENKRTRGVTILFELADALLNDDVDQLFKLAAKRVNGYIPAQQNCRVNPLELDLFFHLCVLQYLLGYERNKYGDYVVTAQFDDLKLRQGQTPHRSMAPFLSRFLPPSEKDAQIMDTMKLIKTEEERTNMMSAMKSAQLDFGRYACSHIVNVRKLDQEKLITLEEQVEEWNWLLIGGRETVLPALEEANRLLRKALTSEPWKEVLAREVIRRVINCNLAAELADVATVEVEDDDAEVLSLLDEVLDGSVPAPPPMSSITLARVEQASNEFVTHLTFMDVFNLCVAIATKLRLAMSYEAITAEELALGAPKVSTKDGDVDWQATLKLRARAEAILREEAAERRKIDIQRRNMNVIQYVQNTLPLLTSLMTNLGWRAEYFFSQEEADSARFREHKLDLHAIRNKFIPKLLSIVAKACSIVDQMSAFFEFFDALDTEDIGLNREEMVHVYESISDLISSDHGEQEEIFQ